MSSLNKKTTYEQKELITSFLDEHDGMRTRKCSAEMTYQKYQNLWNELTLQLNRIGPSKNVKDWQKYWNDQRSRVKRKVAEIKNSQQKTGGGIDIHIEPLSIEDENILKLMGGNIVVSGDNEILEAGLPMFDVGQMYNESFTFSVEDQTNTKQTINNQDMVDTAHDQKDAGEQKTPKRVSLNELILLLAPNLVHILKLVWAPSKVMEFTIIPVSCNNSKHFLTKLC
ncbi:Myb DNA-bind 5 domain-containing protein [Aphis craccivora]|uniref:Regulatory protein zeste n=1 Tax=Aphis craccivora TaxID=307492 RepID=A0A6G0XRX6_APHCR|nr:Myb DNA-bind 5 domain-containing protein [Aphis craccivora]